MSVLARIAADVTSLIDIQQAIRNPHRTAISIDHTCTGYGCRGGMIVYFFFSLFRSDPPLFMQVGRGADDIPHLT
jgi:hypothetical protein